MENKALSLNKKLALTGAFSALIIVLAITKLGFIPLGPTASVTILQIPVILIVLLAGLPEGLFVGGVFGVLSLIIAATSPSGVLDPMFVNPLCSVLPRLLFALVTWGIWKALNFIPKMPKTVSAGITAFVSTLAHTMFVIGCIYIFKGHDVREAMGGTGYWALIGGLAPQAAMEAAASAIVSVAVYLGLFISGKRKSKLSQENDD